MNIMFLASLENADSFTDQSEISFWLLPDAIRVENTSIYEETCLEEVIRKSVPTNGAAGRVDCRCRVDARRDGTKIQ